MPHWSRNLIEVDFGFLPLDLFGRDATLFHQLGAECSHTIGRDFIVSKCRCDFACRHAVHNGSEQTEDGLLDDGVLFVRLRLFALSGFVAVVEFSDRVHGKLVQFVRDVCGDNCEVKVTIRHFYFSFLF